MGNRLEADERPGHHGKYAKNLRKRLCAVWRKRRCHRREPPFVARKSEEEASCNANKHEHRERGLYAPSEVLAPEANDTRDNHYGDGKENLAKIDVEARKRIVPAKLENVAEHIADEQDESSRVGPQDRHVGERQRPGSEVAVVRAKGPLRVEVGTARPGERCDRAMVVPADDRHRKRTDNYADNRSERARRRQELRARHHERAPTNGKAEGEPPRREHRQMPPDSDRCAGIFAVHRFPRIAVVNASTSLS